MNSIDSTNNSVYLHAASTQAQSQAARETQKKEQTKRTGAFSALVKDKQQEQYLVSQGLPPEILGMTDDEAIDFLKDELDMAGDNLGINATPQAYERYKKAVGQFMKFLEKNNYTIDVHKRFGRTRKGKPMPPAFQVKVINEELDKLANDIWYNHLDKLNMLKKIHEINGLVIDLFAG